MWSSTCKVGRTPLAQLSHPWVSCCPLAGRSGSRQKVWEITWLPVCMSFSSCHRPSKSHWQPGQETSCPSWALGLGAAWGRLPPLVWIYVKLCVSEGISSLRTLLDQRIFFLCTDECFAWPDAPNLSNILSSLFFQNVLIERLFMSSIGNKMVNMAALVPELWSLSHGKSFIWS